MAARLIGSTAILYNGYTPPRGTADIDVIGDRETLVELSRGKTIYPTLDPLVYKFDRYEYKIAYLPSHFEILGREGITTPLGILAVDMQTLWAIKMAIKDLPFNTAKTAEDLRFFTSLGLEFDPTDPLIHMIDTEARKKGLPLLSGIDMRQWA